MSQLKVKPTSHSIIKNHCKKRTFSDMQDSGICVLRKALPHPKQKKQKLLHEYIYDAILFSTGWRECDIIKLLSDTYVTTSRAVVDFKEASGTCEELLVACNHRKIKFTTKQSNCAFEIFDLIGDIDLDMAGVYA